MSFQRLVRFVSKDSRIYFGEAIIPKNAAADSFDLSHTKEAYVIVGDIFGKHAITSQIKPVSKLLSPLEPSQIPTVRLIGMNYSKHAAELGTPKPKYPVVFYKPRGAIAGPQDPIFVLKFAQVVENPSDPSDRQPRVDYETELVIVIGKTGKNIPKEKALDYVLGYTVGNDVSQRTWQITRGGSQFSTGKMFDNWAPIGPAIVSTLVIKNPNNLKITLVINGELRQEESTGDMIFNVPELIHFLSQGTTLLPGDLIWTGTPSGVAAGMKAPKWLKDGDNCVCSLEKVGLLENPVVYEKGGARDFKL